MRDTWIEVRGQMYAVDTPRAPGELPARFPNVMYWCPICAKPWMTVMYPAGDIAVHVGYEEICLEHHEYQRLPNISGLIYPKLSPLATYSPKLVMYDIAVMLTYIQQFGTALPGLRVVTTLDRLYAKLERCQNELLY